MQLNDTSRIEIYFDRASIARNAVSRFFSSLSLSLDRHSSRSILGKPGDFSPPSLLRECKATRPMSRGFFLPSFPSREREREGPMFRRWNFIFMLRVRTGRNGCDDIANTRRFSELDETKEERGVACPFSGIFTSRRFTTSPRVPKNRAIPVVRSRNRKRDVFRKRGRRRCGWGRRDGRIGRNGA